MHPEHRGVILGWWDAVASGTHEQSIQKRQMASCCPHLHDYRLTTTSVIITVSTESIYSFAQIFITQIYNSGKFPPQNVDTKCLPL